MNLYDLTRNETLTKTFHMGSSIKDVRTNLGNFGTPPPPVQACPHLVDHPIVCRGVQSPT